MKTVERVVAFTTGAIAGAVVALLVTGLILGGPLYGSSWPIALGSVGIGAALLWWRVRSHAEAESGGHDT
ncbi:hypothetical protein ACFQ9V_17380 [Leifsonia sp. NPDC056665]|uniref:hypothetical protein n=1 Tax=Leifsonia sp. NPDC056665 TaxID=3345901 RepID=UPI0036BD9789